MSNTILIGAQWGDEGKGANIDREADCHDLVVRYQGGANAGHTVRIDGAEYILHLLPSGILRAEKVNVVGNGVVIDPTQMISEIQEQVEKGIEITPENLKISHKAHIIFEYNKVLDAAKGGKIGTTKRGIGQTYADHANRIGLRVCDLYNLSDSDLRTKIEENLEEKNRELSARGAPAISLEAVLEPIFRARDEMERFVCNDIISVIYAHDGSILAEGAQGTMLDKDHGSYPFVTSSNTTIGGFYSGTGVGAGPGGILFDEAIGILKAYTTRVGEGPFPTEFLPSHVVDASFPSEEELGGMSHKEWERSKYTLEEVYDAARKGDPEALSRYCRFVGGEFGATTGRTRRTGWLDLPVARHAVRVNGLNMIAITKLDVLDQLEKIKVCVGYKINGREVDHFPEDQLEDCEPIYEELPGWGQNTTGVRRAKDLPGEALQYLAFIQEYLGVPNKVVGVGPGRKQVIDLF